MKASNEHFKVAQALSAALDPLIDVCLEIGITSPELESLLRAAFVQRAFEKLPRHARTGRGPSDSRVGLAVGVHRSEVSRIRSAGGTVSAKKTMQTKERLYSKSARVLNGWNTDARFLNSGGQPIDLPMERNRTKRSFEDLIDKYAPSTHPGTVLKELKRRGNVEVLADDIVRFKAMKPRSAGVTEATIAEAAKNLKRLGETVFGNILHPDTLRLFLETSAVTLTAEQIARLRPVLERRAKTFIASLDADLQTRAVSGVEDKPRRMGVGVYSWDED